MKMNYQKLMNQFPTKLGEMINSIGQTIDFYEHPHLGYKCPVIAVCHSLKLAEVSDFYGLYDMTAEHGEYEPIFIDGSLYHGDLKAN